MAYTVALVEPENLKLSGPKEITKNFEIPKNAVVAANPILMLMVHGTGPANALKASISINNVVAWTYGPTNADLSRPFHAVLDGVFHDNGLQTGNNTLKVRVESGQGTFRVGEIVIWYQVTV